MCGFSGVAFSHYNNKNTYHPGLEGFRKSAALVSHRGDTDHQEHIADNFWLSHYRLAFQDVQSGIQPMVSHDNKHVIVFNGELYNHLELRKVILQQFPFQFRTRSDTETILEGWKILGNEFFNLFDGEFAFVIIRCDGSEIVAHRDFHGVKPLFFRLHNVDSRQFSYFKNNYSFSTDTLEFSSEIKSLASKKQWCRNGLLRQFTGLFEPICTPFEEIIHIPPGGVFKGIRQDNRFSCQLLNNTKPIRQPDGQPDISEKEFEHTLQQAVADRTLSDVELGIYLSGGVDSKSIGYELSQVTQGSNAVKSFTVGFTQTGYDETQEALRFSKHIGFNPHVIEIDDAALNYSYPLAVQTSELVQPFTNGAAKWWLSLFARQYVQGVLTGDGADEVFCGYPSYRYTNWWRFAMRGRGKAKSAGDVLSLLDKKPLGNSFRDQLYLEKFSTHGKNPWLSGSSAEGDGSDFINSIKLLGVPHPLFGQIQTIAIALLGEEEARSWLQSQAPSIQSFYTAGLSGLEDEVCNPQHALLLWQNYFAKCHLPVLIVNWVGDRMEMSNTLEGRTPFLSKRVYDLMSTQADRLLVHGLRDKVILRKTYARLFPASFAKTPKKQFNAPFLDSEKLIDRFNTNSIFENTGIGSNESMLRLQELLSENTAENSYTGAHLRSAYQTAICLSIVNDTLVNENGILRDEKLQSEYLSRGGPISQ